MAVALAAGLSGMAARLSADHLADATGLAERADRLRQRVAPLAQEDATAYGRVLAAYRSQDDGAPGVRRERIRTALFGAADVPLAIAEAGVRAAAVLVEINTKAGEISDDRVERAGELVARAAGAARGISEGNG